VFTDDGQSNVSSPKGYKGIILPNAVQVFFFSENELSLIRTVANRAELFGVCERNFLIVHSQWLKLVSTQPGKPIVRRLCIPRFSPKCDNASRLIEAKGDGARQGKACVIGGNEQHHPGKFDLKDGVRFGPPSPMSNIGNRLFQDCKCFAHTTSIGIHSQPLNPQKTPHNQF
jgi:hypothetical protein